jgi:hypothetical protein
MLPEIGRQRLRVEDATDRRVCLRLIRHFALAVPVL